MKKRRRYTIAMYKTLVAEALKIMKKSITEQERQAKISMQSEHPDDQSDLCTYLNDPDCYDEMISFMGKANDET